MQTNYLCAEQPDSLVARFGSGGSNVYRTLQDRQRSVRNVLDSAGVNKSTLAYDGYGKVTSESDPNYSGRYGYTGRERDLEIALQYNRARYYDPSTSRWISQDPLGFDAGDSNLYRYVHNRPLAATDPSGLWEDDVHYWMTLYIAHALGFGEERDDVLKDNEAELTAWAAVFTDYNNNTMPSAIKHQNILFHFYRGRDESVQKGSWVSQHPARVAILDGNVVGLGIGLHIYQDSFSHDGYRNAHAGPAKEKGPFQEFHGHGPDLPWNNIDSAKDTAHATYLMLAAYMRRNHRDAYDAKFGKKDDLGALKGYWDEIKGPIFELLGKRSDAIPERFRDSPMELGGEGYANPVYKQDLEFRCNLWRLAVNKRFNQKYGEGPRPNAPRQDADQIPFALHARFSISASLVPDPFKFRRTDELGRHGYYSQLKEPGFRLDEGLPKRRGF